MAGTKPVTSKQMREVKEQSMYVFGRFDDQIVGLEKVVPPVTPISDVAVTSISIIPGVKGS